MHCNSLSTLQIHFENKYLSEKQKKTVKFSKDRFNKHVTENKKSFAQKMLKCGYTLMLIN